MQATAISFTLTGLDAELVRVEVDSGRGLPNFHMVGLPEAAVRESKFRVSAALRLLGEELKEYVLTVNLAPGYLRKSGSAFDLAIAIGILGALEQVHTDALGHTALLGELSLTGDVRPVRGVLPSLIAAQRAGLRRAIVPHDNAAEAAAVDGIETYVARSLEDVVAHLNGQAELVQARSLEIPPRILLRSRADLSEVRGQTTARRALEIAAAGEHHLLMMGPPGAGKTMLARRLPTILPPVTDDEALTITAIHSVAGLLGSTDGLVRERPFRAPHHTVSAAGLLGGGDPLRPGEVSLAHHGVLFLDEMPEFRRHVLEGLRQPLEDGVVTICRARSRATFPARPLLVAAINPCPCGYAGDPRQRCRCTPDRIRAYRQRISGPLLDRLDLHLVLPAVSLDQLQDGGEGEPSARVAARVRAARELQLDRAASRTVSTHCNAALTQRDLDRIARPDAPSRERLRKAVDDLGLTARGYTKLRRIARTIADLEGSDAVRSHHFEEAILARSLDRGPAPSALVRRAS